MKKYLNIILAAMVLMAGCDKIKDDGQGHYSTFSGAVGEWYEGNPIEDHSQRVFVEKYTGTYCVNCPKADRAIETLQQKYGQKVIAVSVYDSSMFAEPYEGSQDLRTPYGETWSHFFGIQSKGYPNCLFNRTKNGSTWDIVNPLSGMDDKIDALLAQGTPVAIAVEAKCSDGVDVSADVHVEFLQNINERLTLTLLVIEDGLVSEQSLPADQGGGSDPNYVHDHVLRTIATDAWGAPIDKPANQGKCYHARYNFKIDSGYKTEHCHVVAFISNEESRLVLNSAECEIK